MSLKHDDISLFALFGITEEESWRYSVRLNGMLPGFDVLAAYYSYREVLMEHAHKIQWGTHRAHYFHTERVLQFIQLRPESKSEWLFIGCSKILPGEDSTERDDEIDRIARYELLPDFKPFEGRLVARYTRRPGYTGMTMNLSKDGFREHLAANMTVDRIAPSPISAVPFPGFANVRLSHAQLVAAVENPEWQSALSSVSAIYLITDTANGWHYVGSAYSNEGDRRNLWSRWSDYAYGDHSGGNKHLQELDPGYIEKNFQYSILEVFDPQTDRRKIIRREHWWMSTLRSVYSHASPFGYNTQRETEAIDNS